MLPQVVIGYIHGSLGNSTVVARGLRFATSPFLQSPSEHALEQLVLRAEAKLLADTSGIP